MSPHMPTIGCREPTARTNDRGGANCGAHAADNVLRLGGEETAIIDNISQIEQLIWL